MVGAVAFFQEGEGIAGLSVVNAGYHLRQALVAEGACVQQRSDQC